jgi:endonuclease YncB( thermonuclease family)
VTAPLSGAKAGDTLALVSGEHVRLILVDTTEITGAVPEGWGEDARGLTVGMVEGRQIALEYDGERRGQSRRPVFRTRR